MCIYFFHIHRNRREMYYYQEPITIRIVLPFKDQIAANAVCRQLRDLSNKIAVTLQPIFVSKKLEQDLKPKEIKPSFVSQQCVVYKFARDLCDADYVGYTARHLHQRIAKHKYSAIGKHECFFRSSR